MGKVCTVTQFRLGEGGGGGDTIGGGGVGEPRTGIIYAHVPWNLVRCRLNVLWDSLCFDSGCKIFVAYFGAYYGLLQYYISMHARIHK